ncbi:aldo/keto reductase [Amycolatopsis rhizosphaerae]|uniref:Aldo/keto reductase n=1 Tax=Amycolatopsis rhizosphaerae TaxID=2053003 RepID=A0A558AMF8_9PSEU|nr:aldo/keto reductase [Amycolatopsis rhizosphaerae]TVT25445.1 aldo/keto reductase [Amycolatopsis rhizosphaerae]
MAVVPDLELNNGVAIPQLGFGVFQVPAEDTAEVVRTALRTGYRSIDTAAAYRNETGVGAAIRDCGLPRGELFVTTKLWNSDQGYDSALRAFDAGMERLGLDYLDLYLIHWPLPARDTYVETWRAFGKLLSEGRVRAIGVSNFQIPHLQRLIDETGVVPAVNQVELHPNLAQAELRAFHADHGIVTEAWSPLAQGALLSDETITGLASRHGRSPAQIVLRWHLQLGNVVIPKSVTPSRIAENFALFDFALTDEDMAAIGKLDTGARIGPDPDTFNLA